MYFMKNLSPLRQHCFKCDLIGNPQADWFVHVRAIQLQPLLRSTLGRWSGDFKGVELWEKVSGQYRGHHAILTIAK